MRPVLHSCCLFFLISLVTPVVLAFTWEEHEGITQWKVDVTDDETGCGSGLKTKSLAVAIQHKKQIAEAGDLGHGTVRGTFESNTLILPPRTIPDGSGQSKLSEVQIVFFPNCKTFTSVYSWKYKDTNMQCSGTTTLKGTRIDATACPEVFSPRMRITEARADPDTVKKEKRYQEILDKDPANFWANWDMAELKMKQGKYDDYFTYFNKAANNEKNFQEAREKLKDAAAKKLRLTTFPTTKTSPILRIEKGELDNWQQDTTYDTTVLKRPANKEAWYVTLWRKYVPDPGDLPWKVAGLPKE